MINTMAGGLLVMRGMRVMFFGDGPRGFPCAFRTTSKPENITSITSSLTNSSIFSTDQGCW